MLVLERNITLLYKLTHETKFEVLLDCASSCPHVAPGQGATRETINIPPPPPPHSTSYSPALPPLEQPPETVCLQGRRRRGSNPPPFSMEATEVGTHDQSGDGDGREWVS